jgi:SET domain-containing protein
MTNKYFAIRNSGVHGKGAFALKTIRKGTRLVEYVGESISPAESDRRYDDTKVKNHHTFLFSVDKRKVIDATYGGNESRFINHSCDPNCDAVIEKRRVYIESNRTIRPGEEVAYDYNYERTPKTTKADERLYRCLCGSPKCRGTIVSAKLTLPRKKAKSGKKAKTKTKAKKESAAKKKQTGSRKKTGRGR